MRRPLRSIYETVEIGMDPSSEAPELEPRVLTAELVAVLPLSPRVRSLRLSSRGPDPLEWVAGQYVEVAPVDEPGGERQPYSIASAPDAALPGTFELAVSRGEGARGLAELPVGALLEVRGPVGRFVQTHTDSPKLYIGTGTGLAPLRAMLHLSLSNGSTAPLVVLHGARTEAEILWRSELESLSQRDARVTFVPTLTRATDAWTGRRGRVQEHIRDLLAPLVDPEIYVCGHHDAVQECRSVLIEELGIASERVRIRGTLGWARRAFSALSSRPAIASSEIVALERVGCGLHEEWSGALGVLAPRVVLGEHARVVLAHALEPLGGTFVGHAPIQLGEHRVRGVSHQSMTKNELRLVGKSCGRALFHQLPPSELVQRTFQIDARSE